MKKLITTIAVLASVVVGLRADSIEIDGVWWEYTVNNNEVTISGCGAADYLIIPSQINGCPVTSIGNAAFEDWYGTAITIPNSVTSIGNLAFHNCYVLREIVIPDSVTSLGSRVFMNCYCLTSISIPSTLSDYASILTQGNSATVTVRAPSDGSGDVGTGSNVEFLYEDWGYGLCITGVKDGENISDLVIPSRINGSYVVAIGEWAFAGSSFTSVVIPEGVTSIGRWAFASCGNLVSVAMPYSIGYIDYCAFEDCYSLTSIRIPGNLGIMAFHRCSSLTHVTMLEGVISIGDQAFLSCYSLASVEIPNTVTSIGSGVFSGCGLIASITIPEGVAHINDGAFEDCYGLSSITVNEGNNFYCSAGGLLFNRDKSELISCPGGFEGGYVIPDGVVGIAGRAFKNCYYLTSIVIPEGVTSIGDWAFAGCDNLASVVVPNGVTRIGECVFCIILLMLEFRMVLSALVVLRLKIAIPLLMLRYLIVSRVLVRTPFNIVLH